VTILGQTAFRPAVLARNREQLCLNGGAGSLVRTAPKLLIESINFFHGLCRGRREFETSVLFGEVLRHIYKVRAHTPKPPFPDPKFILARLPSKRMYSADRLNMDCPIFCTRAIVSVAQLPS
jgi:hypothetical protein